MAKRNRRTAAQSTREHAEQHVKLTELAYDAIAQQYAVRWNDADIKPLRDARSRFAAVADEHDPVIDLGCGTGRDVRWFTDNGFEAVGLDRSVGMLRIATRTAPGAAFVRGDVRRLPFASKSVGSWWAWAVFLHLDTEGVPRALLDAYRVTRRGGKGLLTVKDGAGAGFEPVDGGPYRRYVRYWSGRKLDEAIDDAGWTIDGAWTAADSLGRHPWLTRLVRHG